MISLVRQIVDKQKKPQSGTKIMSAYIHLQNLYHVDAKVATPKAEYTSV